MNRFGEGFGMEFVSARVRDKIKFFEKTGKVTCTNFLTPAEVSEVMTELCSIDFCLSGGFENAERRVVIVGTSEDLISRFCCVIRCRTFNDCIFGNKANLGKSLDSRNGLGKIIGHRDVLGSILGLGIKREMLGDILLSGNFCDIIIMREMKEYILNNLDNIGREKVRCEEIFFDELTDYEDLKCSRSISVASMRLDALISSVFGVSREKSLELIRSERVSLRFCDL